MCPATLQRCLREGLANGSSDAVGPIGGHQNDGVRIETALDERAQQDSPGRRRLGARLAIVQ
jgi:hypothetical protein